MSREPYFPEPMSTRNRLFAWGIALATGAWLIGALVLTIMRQPEIRREVVEVVPPAVDIDPLAMLAIWIAPPAIVGIGLLIAAHRKDQP